ncbi:helix-turn-helix domain-containing protein [Rhodoligotrophos ferricapiens]|uniref:helix-turn-helix domain-containing protein n=1 Tax=Rhodoligotrophos ferricapiens TaxID=3069264 RepID=UPI00315CA60E
MLMQVTKQITPGRAPSVARPFGSVPLFDQMDVMGAPIRYDRNGEIYGEEEPTGYLYRVSSGAVRICRLLSDGRRQISGFYLPGDVFGLEADDTHRFSAEAVVASVITVTSLGAVLRQAERDGELGRQLWNVTANHLARAHEHMLLLGRKSASERLATFLMDMRRRSGTSGTIELPMSRNDIADYLGLTIETVSRTFSQLELDGLIALPSSRRVVVCDVSALEDLAA